MDITRKREREMAEAPKIELFVKVRTTIIVMCYVFKKNSLKLVLQMWIKQYKCSIYLYPEFSKLAVILTNIQVNK